ncbi:sulfotransferase family 2 domain-containing protein [Alteromonas sp. B31-7]|jgi:exonuclease VII small subunit|uniref:sulfotransferase family 2 domain-containing protein n=1 Tax=Alteromonas sp. B31-7 TaxID=2785913 RepID=UPI0018CADAA9|nr:sulfotransferase family 2 domain-containing protein [Alteromonas sp. B31-7]QPL51507.1 sulfotransferase family 2 domain-containing protein [Alteromonas sp. B31-7]
MISHKFKCVFVHVPKTAGQSVEQFFKEKLEVNEKYCEELLITKNDDPAKGPARLAHLRSEEYVACGHLDEDAYQHYFTFGFVRNPWQRLVSEYLHKKIDRKMSLKEFVLEGLPDPDPLCDAYRHVIPQYDFLFDANGNQNVDYIGRFENLHESFAVICNKLELGAAQLPHKNSAYSPRRALLRKCRHMFSGQKSRVKKHYTEYYDDELLKVVNTMYAKDIEQFGYVFGQ